MTKQFLRRRAAKTMFEKQFLWKKIELVFLYIAFNLGLLLRVCWPANFLAYVATCSLCICTSGLLANRYILQCSLFLKLIIIYIMTGTSGNGEETADSYGSRSESWLQNIQARRTIPLPRVFASMLPVLNHVIPLTVLCVSTEGNGKFLLYVLPFHHHVLPRASCFCTTCDLSSAVVLTTCFLFCTMVFLYSVLGVPILYCSKRCSSCFLIVFV